MFPKPLRILGVGHAYIDFSTILQGGLPRGDQKVLAHGFSCSVGGNAVGAIFTFQRLGGKADLLAAHGYDDLGQMFLSKASAHGVRVFTREIETTSVSLVFPNEDGTRSAIRARHDTSAYKHPIPPLDITAYQGLHVDGHQSDAALHYAKLCREHGILTSYDGGRVRPVTEELIRYIDMAVVSEEFCEGLGLAPAETLEYLRRQGCTYCAVTRNEKDILWSFEDSDGVLPVCRVPKEMIVDSNGTGDVFHGAVLFSYFSRPRKPWPYHLRFASVAAALKLRRLGIEAGLPTLEAVEAAMR